MLDQDLKEIEAFEKAQYNPGKKLLGKIGSKWYYIILVVAAIALIIYLMYEDTTKAKLTQEQIDIVSKSIGLYNNNVTTNDIINYKVKLAGKFKPEYIILVLLAIIIWIIWLTMSGPEIELDLYRVDLIARKTMESMIGSNRKFPQGTQFEILDIHCAFQGTLGLTQMNPYKWLVLVKVIKDNVSKFYVLEIRHPDGRPVAWKDMPKDFDREFRDSKYVTTRDVSILGQKKYGMPLGWWHDAYQ
jgi:hypothetical protein